MNWKLTLRTIGVLAVIVVLGAAALIAREFRATSEPTAFETVVSRSVRNLAIPRQARNERNPLHSSPELLQAARDDFLARCATCHGNDADGKSKVGKNLYPRASNLRAPRTQQLTDGDLHYIIENGVQLTGMPAWARRRARNVTRRSTAAGRWQKTPMANVLRDPREHPDAIIPDLATNHVANFTRDQVAFVYGSLWKQHDWPVGYRVGLKLQDFWALEGNTLGETSFLHFPDGTAHKNRMQGNDFVQSVMYRRGVTCFSCHDVHGADNYAQLRQPADKLCLGCHGPLSANGPATATLEAHTHHKAGSTGSQCIACHMPKIESEGVPGTFVRAHTFRCGTGPNTRPGGSSNVVAHDR